MKSWKLKSTNIKFVVYQSLFAIGRQRGFTSLRLREDERENGDYDIFTSFEDSDARKAIAEAEEFLKEMKTFLVKKHNIKF